MRPPAVAVSKGFFGHEAELCAIDAALAISSFVMLLGPGGAGKTRLARSVSAREREVVFCDFSTASGPSDVVRVVANALGISVGGGKMEVVSDQVRGALSARKGTLVVLDNLETVGEGAPLIASWLGSGPRFLGTSRTRFAAPGQVEVEVGPLSRADALALFADRARAVAPEFEPDASTGELVDRLHGSPLAIELAAARAHVLSPRGLLERFSKHIDIVKSSSQAWPERHRSLRAVVMGSWALSSGGDRRALAALSVFVGGFDLDAAEAVIGLDALDRVESLLASSLIHRTATVSGDPRFALYESVRELAAECLGEDESEQARVRSLHAAHFRALAIQIRERASNAERGAVAVISTEAENMLAAFRADGRSALAFEPVRARAIPADIAELERLRSTFDSLGPADRVEIELVLVRACRSAAGVTRALEQAERAMQMAEAVNVVELVVDAAYMLSSVQLAAGRATEAIESAERALSMAEKCGAVGMVARIYGHLGFAVLDNGDPARAAHCAENVLGIAREHGFVLLECFAENLLGAVYGGTGELDRCQAHLERAVALAQKTGHRGQEAIVVGNLGKALMLSGDAERARLMLEEACTLTRLEGNRNVEVPLLTNLALVEADLGRLADARARAVHAERLANEMQHLRQRMQSTLVLGAIALEEARLSEACADFERALTVATTLKSTSGEALAQAGLAACRALSGALEEAGELIERASRIAPPADWATVAIVDARRAVVLVSSAAHAAEQGDGAGAASRLDEARSLVARVAPRTTISVELRIALRLARARLTEVEARTSESPGAEAAPSMPPLRLEIVTRSGVMAGASLPHDADLAFDAIARVVVIDGGLRIDLRKKPISARLLEVMLADPGARFEKSSLFRDVWHGEFRTLAQGAALYKAVDRLTKQLDPDTRRFLRWDEAGGLVLVARRPALLRPAV